MRQSFDFNSFGRTYALGLANSDPEERTVASQFHKNTADLDSWIHRIDVLIGSDCYDKALSELQESVTLYPDNDRLDALLDRLVGQVKFVDANLKKEKSSATRPMFQDVFSKPAPTKPTDHEKHNAQNRSFSPV